MSGRVKPVKCQRVAQFDISTHVTDRGIVERDTQISRSPARKTPSPVKPYFNPPVVMPPTMGGSYEVQFTDGEVTLEPVKDDIRAPSGKTQKGYMKDWLPKRPIYLDRILSQKASPKDEFCTRCLLGRGTWSVHEKSLFHWIERWNGKFYQKAMLWQVGVKIHLGHGGAPCEMSTPHKDTKLRSQVIEHSRVVLMKLVGELREKPEVILETLSRAIDNPLAPGAPQDLLRRVAEAMGQEPLDIVRDLRHAIAEAEAVADETTREAAAEFNAPYVEEQEPPETATNDIPIVGDLEEDDAWEDSEVYDEQKAIPRHLPRPPNADGTGNPYITVVNVSGFHHLPLVLCHCPGKQEDVDSQLLDLKLYPASTEQIRTVFTFAVLDDHRLDNLECKTSTYQYHQKLRRRTLPAFPTYVVNRYAELRRVSRQWRNLKLRKLFGVGGSSDLDRGSMALFCAACPQPGVNLPPDWQAQRDNEPGFGPLGPWPKAMQDTFKRLPGCQERVSAPCRGQILVNMCQQCTEMAGGHKIWYLRASRGAGMGGLGLAGLDDGPIWGGADGKYLSTMQEMMSGVVFWVLLVVGGGFREFKQKGITSAKKAERERSKITEYLEHKKDALGKELAAAASVAPPRPLPSSASILHPLLGDLPICQFLRLQYSSAMLFLGFRVDRGAVPRSFVLLKIQAGSWAIDVAATRLQTDSRGGWNATSNIVCTTFEVKEGRRMVVVLPLAGVV
ncbi:hypothetical protein BDZ97DRAFT_1756988 [Flammula alnicola]|nr:hypothetical protein BDZ97DRAFT_1756988 [Flammula alnicola]